MEVDTLRKDNARLRVDAENATKYETAFNSNQDAIQGRIEMTERIVKEKEDQMAELQDKLGKAEMENVQLKEEINIYKGRCTTLARDVEMHYNEMHKLNNDSSHAGKQA